MLRYLISHRLRYVLFALLSAFLCVIPAVNTVHADTSSTAHGTLSTSPDSTYPIYDDELRLMIDLLIPDYHSMLLVFTECYGGDKLDDFEGKPNTHAISATSAGETAVYGGYHDNAAQALSPGEGKTSADVHSAGTGGKHSSETPAETGSPVSLAPAGSGGAAPESRHVLVYAGQPGGPERYSDNKDRDAIVNNFSGHPNTTVTTVGGNGGPDGYNYPATHAGMIDALGEIAGQMNENEQFILFVTDHGDLHHAVPNVQVPVLSEANTTIDVPTELLDSMLMTPDNDILTGITCTLQPFSEIDPVSFNGQLHISLDWMTIPIIEYQPSLFDLNRNGVKDLPEEYWTLFYPIPEPELIPWAPETYPTNPQGNVDYPVTLVNVNPAFPVDIARVTFDSGPMPRDLIVEIEPNTLPASSSSATLPTQSGGPIHGRDLKRLIERNIPEYHSMLFVLTQCYAGDLANDLDGFSDTHTVSATAPGQTATYGGYHDDAAGALTAAPGRTSASVHTAGTGGKLDPETPTESGSPVSLAPTGSGGGAPASRHVLVYNGQPGGPDEYHDDNDRDQIEENFEDDENTTVTTVGGNGSGDGYDHPATAAGLKAAMEEIGAQMNENEQFILFVGDHGDLHQVQNSGDESAYVDAYTGIPVDLDFSLNEQVIFDLMTSPANDDTCGATLFFDYWDYYPGMFPAGLLNLEIDETSIVYDQYDEIVLDLNGDGFATEEGEGYMLFFPIHEDDLFPWSPETIPAVGGIVDYGLTLHNHSPMIAHCAAATVDSGEMSKGTVAKKETVKEAEYWATLSTNSGPSIYDWELRYLLDKLIPNHHSTLVVLTQCYGGDMMDDLNGREKTGTISATSPGEKAKYGGYDNDATGALKPGADNNSDKVHAAGTAGKHKDETPKKQGSNVSLAPVNTTDGPIKSRHVLYYAGKPGGKKPNSDNTYRDKIKSNFKDKPGTTVTTVGGSGSGAGYDHPGTWKGLTAAMKEISAKMNANEQFILHVSDHGDRHKVKKTYGKKKITPKKWKKTQLKAYEDYIKSLRKADTKAEFEPSISILIDWTTNYPGFVDGDLSLSILGNATEYTDFTYDIVDIDDDGLVDSEGDFHILTFPIPADEMYPWDDDSIPANIEGYVDYEVIVNNYSDETFAFEYMLLDSGPIAKHDPDISETTLTVSDGPNPPSEVQELPLGSTDIYALQVTLSQDGTDPVDVHGITVQLDGLIYEPDEITAFNIYQDLEGDGLPDGSPLASDVSFSTDDPTVYIEFDAPLTFTEDTYLVIYVDTAAPAGGSGAMASAMPAGSGFPYAPLVAASLLPLMVLAVRDRRFRGLALVLVATSFVCFPSCGGGGGSAPLLVPSGTDIPVLSEHESSGFNLRVVEDSLIDGAIAGDFTLEVDEQPGHATVEIGVADAKDLKALYFELDYDRASYRFTDAEVLNTLGTPDELLTLTATAADGALHHGQVLAGWPDKPGLTGSGAMVRLNFAAGAETEAREVSATAISDHSQPSLSMNTSTGELVWRYFNQGDLNMDKLVYVSDLTQLGVHYNATGPFAVNSAIHAVDANRDGLIYLSDITPIGQYYDNVVEGYNVYTGDLGDYPESNDGANGGGAVLRGSVSYDDRTEINDERHLFSFDLGDLAPGEFCWVRPTDGESEGTPSTYVGGEFPPSFSMLLTEVTATDAAGGDITVEGLPAYGSFVIFQ